MTCRIRYLNKKKTVGTRTNNTRRRTRRSSRRARDCTVQTSLGRRRVTSKFRPSPSAVAVVDAAHTHTHTTANIEIIISLRTFLPSFSVVLAGQYDHVYRVQITECVTGLDTSILFEKCDVCLKYSILGKMYLYLLNNYYHMYNVHTLFMVLRVKYTSKISFWVYQELGKLFIRQRRGLKCRTNGSECKAGPARLVYLASTTVVDYRRFLI